MKKVYETPCFMEEAFEVNEYCASSCGLDVTGNYLFECNAGTKGKYHNVWLESNGTPGLQRSQWNNNDDQIATRIDFFQSGYHPCGATHTVKKDDFDKVFKTGYLEEQDGTIKTVVIWRGPNNDNCHVMYEVPQEHWTTQKS